MQYILATLRGILFVVGVVLTTGVIIGVLECLSGNIVGDNCVEGREESSTQFTLNETCDNVRACARLILTYDAQTRSFKGSVDHQRISEAGSN